MRLAAPAKVNFGLRVVGRRPDGYHELESLFLPLDLSDALDVEVEAAAASEVVLEIAGRHDGTPEGRENLAVRAAERFLATAGVERRVRLRLDKQIPVAAGLGGGSSDAGAVLRALREELPGAIEPAALAAVALELGADVPFFLDPRPAWIGGVGERCEPLAEPFPSQALLLANPGRPLSTAAVFSAFDSARPGPPAGSLREHLGPAAAGSEDSLRALLANDLETPAARLCPEIPPLRAALARSGALAVGMSGSGASVFGVFQDGAAAERAATELGASGGGARTRVWMRVARTLESR